MADERALRNRRTDNVQRPHYFNVVQIEVEPDWISTQQLRHLHFLSTFRTLLIISVINIIHGSDSYQFRWWHLAPWIPTYLLPLFLHFFIMLSPNSEGFNIYHRDYHLPLDAENAKIKTHYLLHRSFRDAFRGEMFVMLIMIVSDAQQRSVWT